MTPSPFHGIFSALQEGAGRGGSLFGGDDPTPPPASSAGTSAVGRVAVDIYEQDDYYIIKAPIAGVRLSDLDIEVNENVITIRGMRRQTDALPQDQYYLQECFWGEFSRSVTLPTVVDPRKIKATFNKENVLKILVPKEERVKIVKINEA
ncbi:MAG: Hsp20/alpha crystallin family protein [Candidatus Peregrinibacteria bacterium]|nr:Hsp20/alpha crystallin family protein [Candidatus Peregrinibacteria bacterium]